MGKTVGVTWLTVSDKVLADVVIWFDVSLTASTAVGSVLSINMTCGVTLSEDTVEVSSLLCVVTFQSIRKL